MRETVKRYVVRGITEDGKGQFFVGEVVLAYMHDDEVFRLEQKLEQAYKQVNAECQDWAREYEARRKAVDEREMLAGLLREIAVGISKREMPTEQQLNEWFDRIDTALSAKP
jgi:hypothetical protein